jgi:glucosyl-3-phosphoglycerate synthase
MEFKSTDTWVCANTFDVNNYNDYQHLLNIKKEKNVSISVIIPTLEEEKTIGNILNVLIQTLKIKISLLDEIIVIDGGSKDETIRICESFGDNIRLLHEKHILNARKTSKGKGNQLWKGLYSTKCDIVVYMDSDLKNFNEKYVIGLLGPLLTTKHIKYVKGFYDRKYSLHSTNKTNDGGRVTEICARPLINLLYPTLSGFIQPLSGEYSGYTSVLKNISFNSGYGVEMKILIEIMEKYGVHTMGQVNLISKEHDHQPLNALTKMSYSILKTMLQGKVTDNSFSTGLMIKNVENICIENMKIRSDEHTHCNDSGLKMTNDYFKYTELNDVDLPPINELQETYIEEQCTM